MTAQEFVQALKVVACDSVAGSLISYLERPPGRKSRTEVESIGEWLRRLPEEDKEMVKRIAALAANRTLYNVLLVMDGLLAIESLGAKGRIEVLYRTPDGVRHLNDPKQLELTSVFKNLE